MPRPAPAMGRSFAPRLAADVTSLLSGCDASIESGSSGSSVALNDSEGDGICTRARGRVDIIRTEGGCCQCRASRRPLARVLLRSCYVFR